MTTAVLFDFNRQECTLEPFPSLLTQPKRRTMGIAWFRVTPWAAS
jgi:hypothetical protein